MTWKAKGQSKRILTGLGLDFSYQDTVDSGKHSPKPLINTLHKKVLSLMYIK